MLITRCGSSFARNSTKFSCGMQMCQSESCFAISHKLHGLFATFDFSSCCSFFNLTHLLLIGRCARNPIFFRWRFGLISAIRIGGKTTTLNQIQPSAFGLISIAPTKCFWGAANEASNLFVRLALHIFVFCKFPPKIPPVFVSRWMQVSSNQANEFDCSVCRN